MPDLPFPETAAYLSVRDIAELFQVCPKTVRRWIKAGHLPATKLGRDWRIARSDLRSLAEQHGNGAVAHVL